MVEEYMQHIANRRLAQTWIIRRISRCNPILFPWMSEVMDLGKEKNFFETRVTDYQTGGTLDWGE